MEETINTNFNKLAEATLVLDARSKAIEEYLGEQEKQQRTANFVNRVTTMASTILNRQDVPPVVKKLLFGNSKSVSDLCKNIINAAEQDGVDVDTYLYAMEAIVAFHQKTEGLVKFSQTYRERRQIDPKVLKFAKAMSDNEDKFLAKIGFDLSKPETFINR
jgi:hypothetical protein